MVLEREQDFLFFLENNYCKTRACLKNAFCIKKTTVRFDTQFHMICQTQRFTFDTIQLQDSFDTADLFYFLQKNVSNFFFVRLSSFFAHNLFTNFQYHKTIKNNNIFLIDFFILSSLLKPALCRFLFYLLDWITHSLQFPVPAQLPYLINHLSVLPHILFYTS